MDVCVCILRRIFEVAVFKGVKKGIRWLKTQANQLKMMIDICHVKIKRHLFCYFPKINFMLVKKKGKRINKKWNKRKPRQN